MTWISTEDRLPECGVRVIVYVPDFNEVCEAWYSPNTGLWPRDQEFSEDGEPCNVGWPSHWMNKPAAPQDFRKGLNDSVLSEQIEETLSLIRHNKVYVELEEVDVEAYNMAESLIETLRDKLESAEKGRDEWRAMCIEESEAHQVTQVDLKVTEEHRDGWISLWEETQADNRDLKSDLKHLSYAAEFQLNSLEQYMLYKSSGNSAEYAQRSISADLELRKAIEHTKGKYNE